MDRLAGAIGSPGRAAAAAFRCGRDRRLDAFERAVGLDDPAMRASQRGLSGRPRRRIHHDGGGERPISTTQRQPHPNGARGTSAAGRTDRHRRKPIAWLTAKARPRIAFGTSSVI